MSQSAKTTKKSKSTKSHHPLRSQWLAALLPFLAHAALCYTPANRKQTPPQYPHYSENSEMNLDFSSINCNSLNMASATKPAQIKKIYAICKLNTDIILLSDIRLSKSNNAALKLLQSHFTTNPYCSYKFIYNSTMNKRGVGILIKNLLH